MLFNLYDIHVHVYICDCKWSAQPPKRCTRTRSRANILQHNTPTTLIIMAFSRNLFSREFSCDNRLRENVTIYSYGSNEVLRVTKTRVSHFKREIRVEKMRICNAYLHIWNTRLAFLNSKTRDAFCRARVAEWDVTSLLPYIPPFSLSTCKITQKVHCWHGDELAGSDLWVVRFCISWDSWVVMEHLSSGRKLAFTPRVGGDRDTRKKKRRISQVMRVTCDWHARVATLACQSYMYVYRHETRVVVPPTKARPSFAAELGPTVYIWTWAVRSHQSEACWDLWSYVAPMSLLCRSYVTHKSLAIHSWSSYVTGQKLPLWWNLRLATDLRPCRVTYESSSDIHVRPICEGLATDIRASPELATREKFPDRFESFHTVGEPELLRVFRSRLRPSHK